MEAVKLLPQEVILQEWWQEVKGNFWEEDAKVHVVKLVKDLMEYTMEEEVDVYAGAEYYERNAKRESYRNGYYSRGLVTQFGTIEGIRVPRLRDKRFKTKVFRRYKRYQEVIEDLVRDIFLAGVSTRRVGAAISKLLDTKISSGTVSNILKKLDKKVKEFHSSKILDEYHYLFLDGVTLKIRYNGKYHKRKVIVAYGITVFGQRKLIGFLQSQGESAAACEGLLTNLYNRGLKGDNLKLIVIDGAKGLRAAVDMVYAHVKVQRCWYHKLKNVSNKVKKKYRDDCINGARKIYTAKNKDAGLKAFKRWKKDWYNNAPEAVECLEGDLEEMLHFFECPESHRIKVRTTNVIERCFKEVRRRTRVFSCFSNKESCERIIYAIFAHLNHQWKGHPLRKFTQFA